MKKRIKCAPPALNELEKVSSPIAGYGGSVPAQLGWEARLSGIAQAPNCALCPTFKMQMTAQARYGK